MGGLRRIGRGRSGPGAGTGRARPARPAARGRAGQQTVRRHNLALVLREVAGGEPVSRAGVAARTGLTRGTVSSLVEELIAAGLHHRAGGRPRWDGAAGEPPAAQPVRSGRARTGDRGRPRGRVRGRPRRGGARPADRAVGAPGPAARPPGWPRPPSSPREVVAEAGLPICGAGVALPGLIGPTGRLQRAPNLPRWTDVPWATSWPSGSGGSRSHPATRPTWPRWPSCGSAAGAERPSTSCSSPAASASAPGSCSAGELFRGAGGRAGELGHVVVDPDGPACSCGGRGCLEQAAGQEALLRAAGARDVARAGRRGRAAAIGPAAPGPGHRADRRGAPARRARPSCSAGCTPGSATRCADAVAAELAGAALGRVDVRLSGPGTGGALRGGRGVGGPGAAAAPVTAGSRAARRRGPGPSGRRRQHPDRRRRSAWCRRWSRRSARRDHPTAGFGSPRRRSRSPRGRRSCSDRRGVAGQRGDGAGDTGPRGQDRHRRRSVAGALDPDDDAFARREVPERRVPGTARRACRRRCARCAVRRRRPGRRRSSRQRWTRPSRRAGCRRRARGPLPDPGRAIRRPGIPTRPRRATRPARRCR